MDSVTEKFSVFDFFNLLIVGTNFLLMVTMCYVPFSMDIIKGISEVVGESKVMFVMAVVSFIGGTYILGATFQVIGRKFIEDRLQWEKTLIRNSLNKKVFGDNDIRLHFFQIKARKYLNLPDEHKEFNEEECATFMAHCVYYLHVRKLDGKTEKLRETQGLSELLSSMFFSIPILNVIIVCVQLIIFQELYAEKNFFVITNIASVGFGMIFYTRYKIACINRIRMVISIYDAEVEKEIFLH